MMILLVICIVFMSVVLASSITMVIAGKPPDNNSILMGMDVIVAYIEVKGFHSTPFLVKKWIDCGDIPIRNELDRYFTTTHALNIWINKNKKMLMKISV